MNRVASLVLAALVLLLNITLPWPQSWNPTASAQDVCPSTGGQPGVPCDLASNCFRGCCLTSGVCASTSCAASLNAPNDARATCAGKCLEEVACIPFNPTCPATDLNCIGTVICKTVNCDGRTAGSVCVIAGKSGGTSAGSFKVCAVE